MEEVLRGSSARVRLVKIDTEGAEVRSRPAHADADADAHAHARAHAHAHAHRQT